jgi:hypothetical protein
MPEPRTENTRNLAACRPLMQRTQVIKVVSSLQTWRIRQRRGRDRTGSNEIPFEPDLDAYCVPEAVRSCTEKVRVAVSWGDVFGLRRPERKFYLSFSFHDRHYWGPQRFSHEGKVEFEFLGSFRLHGTTCWHEQRAIATRHPDSSPLSR